MIQYFAVYEPKTGQILQSVQCPTEFMMCGPDEKFIEVPELIDPSTWYVKEGLLVARPSASIHLLGDTLRGVPAGAQIIVEGISYPADGSTVELEFPLPGSYEITVVQWPYLDWRGVYEVKA